MVAAMISKNKFTQRTLKAFLILSLILLTLSTNVSAQIYSFSIPKETVDVYWQSDGTLSLIYEFTFLNSSFADPIDYIDVGMPNSTYNLNYASGSINGRPITHIADSPYVNNGIELGLGSNQIQPGEKGIVRFEIYGIRDVLYEDSQTEDYASAVFSPTWFDSDFVSGSTDLTITYHLPPGLTPEEPRWHQPPSGWPAEPTTGFDTDGRITYSWRNQNANSYTQYLFGASFPATYVPASAIATPTFWQNLGIDFDDILGWICACAIPALFIALPVLGIRSAQKRKLKYLPPKLAVEGRGIKRGLTAIEAAILLEQPMDKILTMILFAVIKKGAADVITRDPLEIKVIDPLPKNLRGYEIDFLNAMKEPGKAKRKKSLQDSMIKLIKGVSKSMKGFSHRETKNYYEKITEAAWKQVEDADTPEVKSAAYDKVMEWTMLDDEYDDRTRRVFRTGPVFVPTWWHRYDPSPAGGSISKAGVPTSRPTPGGTKMPQLPGSDFAASVVNGTQDFAAGVIGSLAGFTSGVTEKTNPVPKYSSSSSGSGRSSGGSSCACACACAGCACACAGGGR